MVFNEDSINQREADFYDAFSQVVKQIIEIKPDYIIHKGSYSIKYVLPAIVPEMEKAYKDLDLIRNGGEAMNAYANMSNLSYEEKMAYRMALLEYCKLDTLAMVNVLNRLKEV